MAKNQDGGQASEPKTVRVDMYGFIGEDWWEPENSNTAKTLLAKSHNLVSGDTLELHINSGGGDFFEGLNIYNNLLGMASKGVTVETYVDGLAASAASLIMLGGSKRMVASASMVMIHNVWSWAVGDAKAMEKAAEELRTFNDTAAVVYAERTQEDNASALTLMDDETWMGGAEALARGFATEVLKGDDAQTQTNAKACVLPQALKKTPSWLRMSRTDGREITPDMMVGRKPASLTLSQVEPAKPAATPVVVPPMETKMNTGTKTGAVNAEPTQLDVQAAVEQERGRSKAVGDALDAALAKNLITAEDHTELKTSHLNAGKTLAETREAILNKIEAKADKDPEQQPSFTAARVTTDARDKFIDGVTQAAFAMSGMAVRDPKNEFNGMGLQQIAAFSLERTGMRTAKLSKAAIAREVLNMNTSSDFPLVLENIQTKAVLKGYEECPEIFDKLSRKGNLPDYKQAARIGTSNFPSLRLVPEGAEYEEATIGERNARIALSKYGRVITISEEMIINDDAEALGRIAMLMGKAAKRTVGNLFWAIITDNPTFNGGPLFSAGRGNLQTGAGSALNDAGLTAAYVVFRTRTDAQISGGSLTDVNIPIVAKYLLAPIALEQQALRLMTAEKIVATGGAAGEMPNTHNGRFEVLSEARLDRVAGGSTRWFLSADANQYDTIEIAYLDGLDTPEVSRFEEWKRDGFMFKVKQVAGVAPLDFLSLLRAEGV